MATTTIYPKLTGHAIDFVADTLRIVLLDNTYTYDDTDEFYSDVIAKEITGTAYSAGGVVLDVAATYDHLVGTTFSFNTNPEWTTATVTFQHAVIFKDSGTDTTSPLITDTDFGADQVITADDLIFDAPSGFFARLLS